MTLHNWGSDRSKRADLLARPIRKIEPMAEPMAVQGR